MPRIQTFLSDSVISEINSIVQRRLDEGASVKEVNLSNITSMLVELGLRVYQHGQENRDSVFDQAQFNRVLLENAVASRLQSAKILAALKLLPEFEEKEIFDLMKIKSDTERATKEIIDSVFNRPESSGAET